MARRKKVKKENPDYRPQQTLTDIEMKLLRLALNKGAYEGESDNAAIMFIRKLRERNVTADDLFSHNQTGTLGSMKMDFGKYKNIMIKDVPTSYLVWVMENCTNIDAKLRHAIHTFLTMV